jgi:hypothetical protein
MKDTMKALRAHAKKPAGVAHGPGAKLANGGITSPMAQEMGRNMARVRNQGPVGRKSKG